MTDVTATRRRAIFRVDASAAIGGGHAMRCLTLAEALRSAGWWVGFACTAETLMVPDLSHQTDAMICDDAESLDAAALSARWPEGCDLLVVDHYGLDARFEEGCRGWARAIAVVDDLADRQHDCDLLIDVTPGRTAFDYHGLIPPAAHVLCGPDYAMLRREFAIRRPAALARRAVLSTVKRIFVSLGLTDLNAASERVVRALLATDGTTMIDVVIGPTAASRPGLEELSSSEPRLTLHIAPADMVALMMAADLAVGAAGSTSWERCCLGLPAVLVILADNQRLVAARLATAGAAVPIPAALDPSGRTVASETERLGADIGVVRRMSANAAALVDGLGCERVVDHLNGLFSSASDAGEQMEVRPASKEDSRLIFEWRNDPVSRAFFRNREVVAWEDHQAWFASALVDPDRVILIGMIEDEPVGVVRFDRSMEGDFWVSINVAPGKRDAGRGKKLLAAACRAVVTRVPRAVLMAYVKHENARSRRIFTACGFNPFVTTSDLLTYRRQASLKDGF